MSDAATDTATRTGFLLAAGITRAAAKSFYFASHFLPGKTKQAAYAIYAICRLSDETVDTGGPEGAAARIRGMERRIACAYDGSATEEPLVLAFRKTVETYRIPRRYFDQLIEGMRMDVSKTRYRDFGELYAYCYRVAGVVGLIMCKVFKGDTHDAQEAAVHLGIAMQLTNILRDIKEDFARARVYLPQEEILAWGVSEEDIRRGEITVSMKGLLQSQISRARDYYAKAERGIKLIPARRYRLVICLMSRIYAGILQAIEDAGYDVFSRRATVSYVGKIAIAFKVITKGDYL
ncbi:MAG TPA: phytoene/squalene synthase family protein [Patescibacteria group bacterium]|nr:phytoene/squalene synthase family protein [Patescibacteria group bacterium]